MDKIFIWYRVRDDYKIVMLVYVVWEIILVCNLKCLYCGFRVGKVRSGELIIE